MPPLRTTRAVSPSSRAFTATAHSFSVCRRESKSPPLVWCGSSGAHYMTLYRTRPRSWRAPLFPHQAVLGICRGLPPKLRPLPGAGQDLRVNDGRAQKRLGARIVRVPSDQEKDTKPTLGWRGCREREPLIETLIRVCGNIGDGGLAVDVEHHGRGRSLGGHNQSVGDYELDLRRLVVAFERKHETKRAG